MSWQKLWRTGFRVLASDQPSQAKMESSVLPAVDCNVSFTPLQCCPPHTQHDRDRLLTNSRRQKKWEEQKQSRKPRQRTGHTHTGTRGPPQSESSAGRWRRREVCRALRAPAGMRCSRVKRAGGRVQPCTGRGARHTGAIHTRPHLLPRRVRHLCIVRTAHLQLSRRRTAGAVRTFHAFLVRLLVTETRADGTDHRQKHAVRRRHRLWERTALRQPRRMQGHLDPKNHKCADGPDFRTQTQNAAGACLLQPPNSLTLALQVASGISWLLLNVLKLVENVPILFRT